MKDSNLFIKKFEKFVNGSETFIGFMFNGHYTMDVKEFVSALSHYMETGKNVLDEHSRLLYLAWDAKGSGGPDQAYFSERERNEIKKLFKNNGFWDIHSILTSEAIARTKALLKKSEDLDAFQQTYPFRRKQACAHTNKAEVRRRIFERDGYSCNTCQATENLQIDHIKPVYFGGTDEDENLQVLCATCNIKKSNKEAVDKDGD